MDRPHLTRESLKMPAALRQKARRRASSAGGKGFAGGRGFAGGKGKERLQTLPLPFLWDAEPSVSRSDASESSSHNPAAALRLQPAGPVLHRLPAEHTGHEKDARRAGEAEAPPAQQEQAEAVCNPSSSSAQQALVAQLAREVQRIEVAGRPSAATVGGRASTVFSTGCGIMDGCLPSGGYDSGTVVEYLQTSSASGATSLALTAAREALVATERFCVLVDWRQQFYPPAAAALGVDLRRVIIVRPHTLAERLWAIDQALRSPAVVAVIAEVEHLDDRAARRLQLAAECGGGIGLLVRGEAARQHPSWAEVQWLVRPLPERSAHRQLELQLMRARGGRSGAQLRVQINATHGRVEAAPAAAAVLARTLAQPRPQSQPAPRHHGRSA